MGGGGGGGGGGGAGGEGARGGGIFDESACIACSQAGGISALPSCRFFRMRDQMRNGVPPTMSRANTLEMEAPIMILIRREPSAANVRISICSAYR